MRSTLDIVGRERPTTNLQGLGATVLVVSRERVGRVFIAQTLREHGLRTIISDNAQQAARRMQSGHGAIRGIVIVGDLADGTAESYQRWLRNQGHNTLPLIGIGSELDPADPYARAIDARQWFAAASELLADLGLRHAPVGSAQPNLPPAAAAA